jgi:TolA-binding protein
MTKTQKIIGTSLFSLLLVCVGMFMVCSGRSARVGNEEDYAAQEDLDEKYRNDLLAKLEYLENQSGLQPGDTEGEPPILVVEEEPLSQEGSGSSGNTNTAESFLTPELFSGMQSEISDLQAVADNKEREVQAMRGELRDVDARVAAASTTGSTRKGAKSKSASSTRGADYTRVADGELGTFYRDALDDYYKRSYDSAISKFMGLLGRDDEHSLADNCQYWIGESYYAKGDYLQAVAEFQKVLAFGENNKQEDAQLMVGLAFMKAGERELALQELMFVRTYSKNQEAIKKAEKYMRLLDRV